MTLRSKIEESSTWFPVVDLACGLKNRQGKLTCGIQTWLKNNLPEGTCRVVSVPKSTLSRAGKYLCVTSDAAKYVSMYERHVLSGKNFRAKWADLPDSPRFNRDVRLELSWKNVYKWSKTDHRMNSGIDDKSLSEMRSVEQAYVNRFGKYPECTYNEARIAIGLKEV